jgi:hypothetical protein
MDNTNNMLGYRRLYNLLVMMTLTLDYFTLILAEELYNSLAAYGIMHLRDWWSLVNLKGPFPALIKSILV